MRPPPIPPEPGTRTSPILQGRGPLPRHILPGLVTRPSHIPPGPIIRASLLLQGRGPRSRPRCLGLIPQFRKRRLPLKLLRPSKVNAILSCPYRAPAILTGMARAAEAVTRMARSLSVPMRKV